MKPSNKHFAAFWRLVSGLSIFLLMLTAFIPVKNTVCIDRESQMVFSLGCLERATLEFKITEPGIITAEAEWLPAESPAVLLLYGPGQMNYYFRQEGNSGRKMEFTVTERHIARGTDWSVAVLNQQDTKISGLLKVHFPGEEPK